MKKNKMDNSDGKVKRTKEHVVITVGESSYEGTVDNALTSMAFIMLERNQLKSELEALKKNNNKKSMHEKLDIIIEQTKPKKSHYILGIGKVD